MVQTTPYTLIASYSAEGIFLGAWPYHPLPFLLTIYSNRHEVRLIIRCKTRMADNGLAAFYTHSVSTCSGDKNPYLAGNDDMFIRHVR